MRANRLIKICPCIKISKCTIIQNSGFDYFRCYFIYKSTTVAVWNHTIVSFLKSPLSGHCTISVCPLDN